MVVVLVPSVAGARFAWTTVSFEPKMPQADTSRTQLYLKDVKLTKRFGYCTVSMGIPTYRAHMAL